MLASFETPDYDTHALDEALRYLRVSQNGDGGWGPQRGRLTDLYTALYVTLALERYRNYDFDADIADGVNYIKSQQLGDGSFGYDAAPVPYVTALAALALVGGESYPFSTATERAVTALRAQQQPDGSWAGEPFDTSLAMLALWRHGRPPSANAGADAQRTDTDGDCVETLQLAGSGTSNNGPITRYDWSETCRPVASGATPTVTLPVGRHDLVLTVTDSTGLLARDTVIVTVAASGQTACADTDRDGALDDGDGSGIAGDAPCRDGFVYGCDDNCPGLPIPLQTNSDRDQRGDACDCDSANAQVWSFPGQVELRLTHVAATGQTTIRWETPTDIGGVPAPLYDTLRSLDPRNFTGGATCIGPNGADTQTVDTTRPPNGQSYHYLVRAENACPGGARWGTTRPERSAPAAPALDPD